MGEQKQTPSPPLDKLTHRIDTWSSRRRISVIACNTIIFAIIITFGLLWLIRSVLSFDGSWLITLIVLALGTALYAGGWQMLVGFKPEEEVPWQATRGSTYYVLAGVGGGIVLVLGIIGVLVFGNVL